MPQTCSKQLRWIRLISLVTMIALLQPHSAVAAETKPIKLKIEFADQDKSKTYEALTWREGMTVLDAMNLAKSESPKLEFQYQGSGRTAFLWSIDDVKNEGRSGRNWIFRVNGKRGEKSFGIYELQAGAVVHWKFEEYP